MNCCHQRHSFLNFLPSVTGNEIAGNVLISIEFIHAFGPWTGYHSKHAQLTLLSYCCYVRQAMPLSHYTSCSHAVKKYIAEQRGNWQHTDRQETWGLIDLIKTLNVYVGTKARFCVCTQVFRFIKPCVRQNLCKNPFINPIQGKIVLTCISTSSPPRNHHIWSLQCLVLLCISSSAYHFHAYSHPRDTMFQYSCYVLK